MSLLELVWLNKLLKSLLFRSNSSCLLWFLFMHDHLMQLRVFCSAPVAHIHFKLFHLTFIRIYESLCVALHKFLLFLFSSNVKRSSGCYAVQVALLRRAFSEIRFYEGELAYTCNLVACNTRSNYTLHI